MNITFNRQLPTPQEIKNMYPVPADLAEKKKINDLMIKDVLTEKSDKFLLIIGPCSADREDAVIDYIKRLRTVADEDIVKKELVIIPRIYTNKPRTTGEGYKGMLHQPNPNEAPDMLKGIIGIRRLHLTALSETGFSCADEMLYPENHSYLSDLLSYVAVGARSVENQQHRLTASGIDIPVGMKNPTSGDFSVMLNAIKAAESPHTFIYRNFEAMTKGNPLAHAILRGYVNHHGESHENYHYETLNILANIYDKEKFLNPAVIIDCNHSNSGKKYMEQIRIAKEILHSMTENEKINNLIKGLMIESYIEDGNQKIEEGVYGKSITDPCLGWEKSKDLIREIAHIRNKNKGR
ncbi:MAG: 3-deoxy-7-phosphoheptulonate synthase [Lachnospiraceae bacterium]|nr:3-deoxy-7-phosphoheptulonate synthase [Lachnospiraceae bacterium]